MRIGVLLPTRAIVMRSARRPAVDECWEMARHCDRAGYDAVWVGDSVVAKPRLEPLTTLAYVAAMTERVRLGTAVLLPALRQPVVLAHQISQSGPDLAGARRPGARRRVEPARPPSASGRPAAWTTGAGRAGSRSTSRSGGCSGAASR